MGALYLVIKGQPIVWAVVDFAEGYPRVVPIGRFDPQGDGSYQGVPVDGGEVKTLGWDDEAIYAPDYGTLVEMILTGKGEPA